jgi:FkbM family methyltransferase
MRSLRVPTPGYARAFGFAASLVLACCGRQPRTEVAPSARPIDAPAHRDILGKKLAQGKILYSQHNEELIIRDFFQDRRDGVFLDVGCAWPKKDNNTFFLESELGWSGIAVDALKEYEPEWRRERPHSRFFAYAVTDHSGSYLTFFRSELTGSSSIERPQPLRGTPTKGRKTSPAQGVKYEKVRVPTITLTKLLDDNGIGRIDLLSIDIEGAELLALSGFDIDRFRPQLVCIEWFHAGREKIQAYFSAHGYERIQRYLEYDKANDYYTPKASRGEPGQPSGS